MTDAKYDPRTFSALTFFDCTHRFTSGEDTPRAYLERCIDVIEQREPVVQAFAHLNVEGARIAADESTKRWQAGAPRSAIDGMPIGIKDLLETKDMPTQMNCDALAGNFPKRDNAAVWALREAGAIPFGKTVTAELGGSHPGPTTNPFDRTRTPGGSSSGSAAAVAARMMPAAIGSQVGGSIIRPAGYCGNFALKPTQGGINRGERNATSMSTHGVHAGSLQDMWQVAIEIAGRAGGDRGCRALSGPQALPAAIKPQRLIILETEGWSVVDDTSKQAFETFAAQLQERGVELVRRANDGRIEALEKAMSHASRICLTITAWENRWAQRNIVNEKGMPLSERAMATLAKAEASTVEIYELALIERDQAQALHRETVQAGDAMITLSCPGPASIWQGDEPGNRVARPTGDAIFNYASSMLFAPVVSIPMLAVSNLPVGVQVIGQQHTDAAVTAYARWIHENAETVSAA